jgi:membrane-bound lytic murein transglycosylase D
MKKIIYALCLLLLCCVAVPSVVKAEGGLRGADYQASLEELEKTVPLTYNRYVQAIINSYTNNHKLRFSKILGLSKYYFPIYERVFREKGLPEELKYLSAVESDLRCNAVSRAQAVGPWQLLEPVGRRLGLTVNDSLDERRDPILSSYAAADYLLESYEMYHDWLLVIASYNCGHNNIRWATEKANGAKDYWSIRQYLPVETQNYVPAFIATVYMMNNYKKHGVRPADADFKIFTSSVEVNRRVTLHAVAKALNVSLYELTMLNPAYKNQVINGTATAPRRLVVPELKPYIQNALADAMKITEPLYGDLKLNYVVPVEEHRPALAAAGGKYVQKDFYITYRVQEGDTLGSIAEKFKGTTEEEIRVINKLKHYGVKAGMVLKIIQG